MLFLFITHWLAYLLDLLALLTNTNANSTFTNCIYFDLFVNNIL